MATQAVQRQQRKEKVRVVKRMLRKVDTQLEVMERRLDKMLEVEREVSFQSFESFLQNWDNLVVRIQNFERTLTAVMVIFRLLG